MADPEVNIDENALQEISDTLTSGKVEEAQSAINALHPAEIAHVLESLPPDERVAAWELVTPGESGDVLAYVNDEVRSGLIKNTSVESLLTAAENLDPDDLVDILPDLPEDVINPLLHAMDVQDRHRLESILQYPDDTAGGLMNIDSITIRPDVTLDVVMRYLRFRGQLPDTTDKLFVVNREDKLLGALPLSSLLTSDQDLTVAEVFTPDIKSLNAMTSARDVANIFEKRDLISAPVIDENSKLLGRITIDDVVDIIVSEAEHSFLGRAGLDEEDDIFSPVIRSSRRRAVWLGINLVTALLASWVIGLFQATIEHVVALAVLAPIVASMGGIAGSQTLTLVIRGLAVGQVAKSNILRLFNKELLVGVLNGILWAAVIALLAYLWFGNIKLGAIIGMAILVNLMVAAIAGATIPLLLQRFGADPALAGSVVLTTVTDVVGFFSFLGLATLLLR